MAANNFDLSALSYEDFLNYFFTSSEDFDWRLDFNGEVYWMAEINQPGVVLQHLTRLCLEFKTLADRVSIQTIDHGIEGMLSGGNFQLQSVLWNNSLDLQKRIHCIRSMRVVFADFVAACKDSVLENSFYMWWDFVCSGFWFEQTYERKLPSEDYALLPEVDQRLVDAMFETLVGILKLDDDRTRDCAFHGLGHLHHPGVRAVVQEFIDSRADTLHPDKLSWLITCRDGRAM